MISADEMSADGTKYVLKTHWEDETVKETHRMVFAVEEAILL